MPHSISAVLVSSSSLGAACVCVDIECSRVLKSRVPHCLLRRSFINWVHFALDKWEECVFACGCVFYSPFAIQYPVFFIFHFRFGCCSVHPNFRTSGVVWMLALAWAAGGNIDITIGRECDSVGRTFLLLLLQTILNGICDERTHTRTPFAWMNMYWLHDHLIVKI